MTRTRVINAESEYCVTILSENIPGIKLIYVPIEEVNTEEPEELKKESEGVGLKS
jgi:hypothetical protein